MPTLTIAEALKLAFGHHQSGRLQDAEQIYRQILQQEPNNVDALHHLGLVAHQVGRQDVAIDLMKRSIALFPNSAGFHVNLGEAYRISGQLDLAVAEFQLALQLNPSEALAHNNIGLVRLRQNRLDEAVALFRKALQCNPALPSAQGTLVTTLANLGKWEEALQAALAAIQSSPRESQSYNNAGWVLDKMNRLGEALGYYQKSVELNARVVNMNNLGAALLRLGRRQEAVALWQRAAQLPDATVELLCNLGIALREMGRLQEAAQYLQHAIKVNPNYIDAYNHLGMVYNQINRPDMALPMYEEALKRKPDAWEVYNNLGAALEKLRRIDDAIKAWEKTVELNPRCGEAWNNLGGSWKDKGLFDKAIHHYQKSLEANPTLAPAHSNMLLVMHYLHGDDPGKVFAEHRRFNELHAKPLASLIRPHSNDPNPDRKLRIGYVSADFCAHSVMDFFLSILAHRDREQHEIVCYSDVDFPDPITQQGQKLADQWRDIRAVNDIELADLVRNDKIDILVDLGGHSGKNRLLAFACKPAPVQVTYLGYPDTTGLDAMDYRITDDLADPPGQTEQWHSEKLVRLPRSFLCYHGYAQIPPVDSLPALKNNYITFGSFNNFAKVSPDVMELWSKVLAAVPNSRMMIKATGVGEETTKNYIREHFAKSGISADRLDLRGREPEFIRHLELYHQVDIALDTFPYHGTTTTCEAIRMGCPVVTLEGAAHVSRVGVSLLSNIGVGEWIARTPEQFVGIAANLAGDLEELKSVRAGLREKMTGSVVMDGKFFMRNLEKAFREMWKTWCDKK
jgi:protein O-GlcNAc transferase